MRRFVRLARALAAVVSLAGGLLALSVSAAAAAPEAMHGVVVAVLPGQGQVVVRHDAFNGMPAMTMSFAVAPKSELMALQPGDRIQADADFTPDIARLTNVRVTGTMPSSNQRIVHDVPPLNVGDTMPLTEFFDQRGQAFDFNDFRGQTVVLAFIYTRCKDPRMCPLVSSNFHVLQRKLAGLPVHLVEITLDPTYDTPQVLANYGRRFDVDPAMWSLGTGPANVVNDFAARFGIAVFPDQNVGLIHSERTAIIDRNGAIVDLLDAAAWNPYDVIAEVQSLSNVPSNPIARIDYELSKASAALCGNSLAGYSGLLELALVVAIFSGACDILYVAARKIFVEDA
jgi:protein SCO1/2